jgi:hypothetical protein
MQRQQKGKKHDLRPSSSSTSANTTRVHSALIHGKQPHQHFMAYTHAKQKTTKQTWDTGAFPVVKDESLAIVLTD